MSKASLAYVEKRLQQWVDWFSHSNLYNLGYSPCTIEYRLMNEGVIINSTAPRQFRSNLDAEEIEYLVKLIGKTNKKVELALRSWYFSRAPFRDRAKQVGISYA